MTDTQRKAQQIEEALRQEFDGVSITFKEQEGGPGQSTFRVAGFVVHLGGKSRFGAHKNHDLDLCLYDCRRTARTLQREAIAEAVTGRLGIDGARVVYESGQWGGYRLQAGAAGWSLAEPDASEGEVYEAAMKIVQAQRGTVEYYAGPDDARGSLGQSWWDERG